MRKERKILEGGRKELWNNGYFLVMRKRTKFKDDCSKQKDEEMKMKSDKFN